MKLADHVDHLRELIEAAFDKQFARLGFSKTKQMDAIQVEKLPEEVKAKRERFAVMLDNHIGETGGYDSAREKLLDELTFTLFNRLAAIKVMEAASLFPPILTKQKEHGDRSFGHKAWLEMNPHMRDEELEGIRDYLKSAFDELGQTLPLYSKTYPYALLPDAISLNDIIDAFNTVDTDAQANESSEETIWQSDDVLGWMYESYNNAKKKAHKDSGDKTEYNKVSLQSQVYTPRWVVQFLVENSLGKMYLEMYPHSEIKQRYKIANAPTTQTRTPKPLHEVRTIDPACGSGNFLLYAFDFYYELYLDQIENYGADYDEKDIPKLIIENNLHGIDLDDRAIQLAQLGLFIKAKKKRRTVGELHFKVVSSDFYLPEYEAVKHIFEQGNLVSAQQREFIEKVWADLMQAYKFGSLIHIDKELKEQLSQVKELALGETFDSTQKLKKKIVEGDLFAAADYAEHQEFAENFFANLFAAVEQYARTERNTFLSGKTRDAITFLELLTTEYDVATANPPYTDSGDFGPDLRVFVDTNFKKTSKFHTNLYSAFMKRCFELTSRDGYIAMVHPNTFMFIKTFDGVRKFIINNLHLEILVDYGLDRVNLFGGDVLLDSNCFYVLSKNNRNDKKSIFIDVDTRIQEKHKKESFTNALSDIVRDVENSQVFKIFQSEFLLIESLPFIYWISEDLREKFTKSPLHKVADVVSGVKTGNNNGALRLWWEVDRKDIYDGIGDKKWVLYTKGGKFKKWQGNNWLCVDWNNNCSYIKKQNSYNIPPENISFSEGINYSGSGQKGVCFRFLEKNVLFDMGSSAVFPKFDVFYALSVLNSKLAFYMADCLNPTVNKQPNDVKRIPLAPPTSESIGYLKSLSESNISIYQHLERFSLLEMRYSNSPIDMFFQGTIRNSIKDFLNYENAILSRVLVQEAMVDEEVFKLYNLTENDKKMVLAKQGHSVGGLPVCSKAREEFISKTNELENFTVTITSEFIHSLPVIDFSPEKREVIESHFAGLYQKNNDLEEFCIRHQINPINVWYWFKQSKVIPKQRMQTLAMEFLADIIREILMEDEDGIIPLVPNAGEKVLLDRIEEKFLEKGFSTAQYSSFESVLGRPINDYLNKNFFAELSDHLNLFMYLPKTPFIWHLTSGPEQGFDCYIIIYKWNRDNLLRLRSVYIENRERALQNRQSDIAGNESAEAQNEKERIFKQLKEIDAFKKKIDELLAEGYNPILDDGVGKNIAPLQKKKILAYDVLNAGQLKKYLNADW
ncbi:BREX-1 system adenine-specific DNA-methyltransferase PglX [Paraglaciecola polaris]|uniref:site-specific DNA-methyltransferase (adenine-specific) n=1 Tax=Paraglaciecola polaris LMG 21857 TaxID=1129793 RepID=K6ZAU6_9ALTE|nr:BREX-1 system adenine-specific DNA-methyltransferase PglX [Paraglaciecola polaris]GAC33241.1 conserved hypothetical protein [Paraglaciecola polaris LMG 21857]